jgi:hypothetical protein
MQRKILQVFILIFGLCLLGNNSRECGKKDSACSMEKSSTQSQTRQAEWISEEYMLIHDLFFQTI